MNKRIKVGIAIVLTAAIAGVSFGIYRYVKAKSNM